MKVGYLRLINGFIDQSFIMIASGQALGGEAFWKSCSALFTDQMIIIKWKDDPEEVKSNIDVLVIPAAIFLMEGADFSILKNLVSQINKPVIMVELGAQSEDESQIPVLKNRTIEFIKEFSKRIDYIGVRGEFSEKVCRYYGVDNVKVMECHSIFLNLNPNLGFLIESKIYREVTSFSTASASVKGNLTGVERILFHLTNELSGKYIVQRPSLMLKVLRDEVLTEKEHVYPTKFKEYVALSIPVTAFLMFIRKNCSCFTSADSWLEFHRSASQTFNTCIHGAILPFPAGVPSVCITHDTRTRELSSILKIPSIYVNKFSEIYDSVHQVFEACDFYGKEFNEKRRELARDYKKRFESAALTISNNLGFLL